MEPARNCGGSRTGRGLFAVGQGGTAVGLALGLQSNTPLPGEEGWQNISGGSVWALPLLSQARPAWPSTQAFQLSGQAVKTEGRCINPISWQL